MKAQGFKAIREYQKVSSESTTRCGESTGWYIMKVQEWVLRMYRVGREPEYV